MKPKCLLFALLVMFLSSFTRAQVPYDERDEQFWLLRPSGAVVSPPIFLNVLTDVVQFAEDFDGDGDADVLFRKTSGAACLGFSHRDTYYPLSSVPCTTIATVSFDWLIAGVGDTNSDGKADIVWLKPSTGEVVIWEMNGATISFAYWLTRTLHTPETGYHWVLSSVADLDGDGRNDLTWVQRD